MRAAVHPPRPLDVLLEIVFRAPRHADIRLLAIIGAVRSDRPDLVMTIAEDPTITVAEQLKVLCSLMDEGTGHGWLRLPFHGIDALDALLLRSFLMQRAFQRGAKVEDLPTGPLPLLRGIKDLLTALRSSGANGYADALRRLPGPFDASSCIAMFFQCCWESPMLSAADMIQMLEDFADERASQFFDSIFGHLSSVPRTGRYEERLAELLVSASPLARRRGGELLVAMAASAGRGYCGASGAY
jgi:hypothetical protein